MARQFAWIASLSILTVVSALCFAAEQPATAKKQTAGSKPDAAAVERARKTVRMLDDVYKQTIVLITDKYVNKKDDFAAGSAAVLLFKNISKSGNQQVRLLDATGEPYEPDNVAKDAFEKTGVARIKAGTAFYDEVIEKDGKYQLRAMTAVPVVMDKCIMCHDNYAAAKKKGEAIGAISYTVPIE